MIYTTRKMGYQDFKFYKTQPFTKKAVLAIHKIMFLLNNTTQISHNSSYD